LARADEAIFASRLADMDFLREVTQSNRVGFKFWNSIDLKAALECIFA
jgi:hypothetical protein